MEETQVCPVHTMPLASLPLSIMSVPFASTYPLHQPFPLPKHTVLGALLVSFPASCSNVPCAGSFL